jgi:hypothetical protein
MVRIAGKLQRERKIMSGRGMLCDALIGKHMSENIPKDHI